MASVVLSLDGAIIKEYPLGGERVSIGRKPENDIRLDDPTVSGRHAALIVGPQCYVEDLGSTNGTLVNGKPVQRRMLHHGDVVRIGRHEFRFLQESKQDFTSTVVIPPDSRSPEGLAPLPVAKIRVLEGPKLGEALELTKPFTTVGRPGEQVAVIARRAQGYFLTPVGGAGKAAPIVNGAALGVGGHRLEHGDVVEIAGSRMEFLVVSGPA